ncbi:hypothetical protein ACJMK2_018084 [Sinanodonta woodiana]|uniref:RRM domain-containing protein n=1 Tax=Sinanodonta woodiana TaxID=1069815 RepID=A0ABD3UDU9_SINWO
MMNQGGIGFLDPAHNNQPLQFNLNKGKPPMPLDMDRMDMKNNRSGDMPGVMGTGDDHNIMMHGGPPNGPTGFFGGPMGGHGLHGPGMGFPNPMMGPGPDIMNQMMMFQQFGGWGPMGPIGPGGPLPPPPEMLVKEIITLKSCVLYPPPPNAPSQSTRERPPGCRTIFVGGLPENVTDEILQETFCNFGNIVSIRKSKKNFAHIRFESEDCVDRALYLSGYRMKIEDKDDKDNTGRLHVDYAQARDDQYEFECKQRALQRELRHRHRMEEERLRPPSPPPIIQYSDFEANTLIDKLKSNDEFLMASQVFLTWMERGDCNRRNASTFYTMIQCTNAHIRHLLGEKQAQHEEQMRMKEKFRSIFEGIIRHFDQIVRVFTTAQKQRNWDHFSKAQRKNIDQWLKQAKEIKSLQENELLSDRQEAEMEMSDEEEVAPIKKKRADFDEDLTAQYAETAGKLSQLNSLKDENDALKCQVEAYKNEIDMVKHEYIDQLDQKDRQLKSLQQALQGMQQQLINARTEITDLQKTVAASENNSGEKTEEPSKKASLSIDIIDIDQVAQKQTEDKELVTTRSPTVESKPQTNFVSTTGLAVTEKEAKLLGLVSCFLHVHPTGASIDYIWSYLHRLGVETRVSELESLMEKMPMIFRQDITGVGATIERHWHFTGYTSLQA